MSYSVKFPLNFDTPGKGFEMLEAYQFVDVLNFHIKNILILLVAGGYFYFYFVLGRNKKSIEEKSNQKQASVKEESKSSEMVDSLDEFLSDDELNK